MVKYLRDLPVGTKVIDPNTSYYGAPIVWVVASQGHYSINTTVLLSERVLSFKAIDAKEPNNPRTDRARSGNNRYIYSNIRAWLNSSSTGWYSATHEYDAPPIADNLDGGYNPYSSERGFLSSFTKPMLATMVKTSLKVSRNTPYEGGNTELFSDKVFLPSLVEVNSWSAQNGESSVEGKVYDLFKGTSSENSDSRVAYPTQKAIDNNTRPDGYTTSSKVGWWLRSPRMSVDYFTMYIDGSGGYAVNNCYRGDTGIRPAINIYNDTVVSESPDMLYSAHRLYFTYLYSSSANKNLGSSSSGENMATITVRYPETGYSVSVKVNGMLVNTYSNLKDNDKIVVSIPADIWGEIPYGKFTNSTGGRNTISIEPTTGEKIEHVFTKVLPTNATLSDSMSALDYAVNTSTPANKKLLVDAIGNRAVVGGTKSLEDIAKAVDSINLESLNGVRVARGTTTIPSSGKLTISGLNFKPQLLVYISTRKNSLGYRAVAVVGRDVDYAGDPYARVSFQEHSNGTYKPPSVFTDTSITIEGASSVSGETINYIVYGGTIL